ncbi:phosphoribosyltransferase family protein [uncultured Tenacibaculum sp.]|uniref:ComF family protein n=1 Tax=uncultured Tenacibaculum sp. TaxID=174713 RepID=UPI00262ED7B5|nr:phosphoribosyltransferase family protein [uncultured Tenacibaculum sp.]
MRFLKDLFGIFYPNLCLNCENNLFHNEKTLCVNCKNELPIIKDKLFNTPFFLANNNLQDFVSFLYYRKDNITQKIIHELKYNDREDVGDFLGNWFSYELSNSKRFTDIDYVIPVPLHKKKLKKRGYNQVSSFAKSLAKNLNSNYNEGKLVRVSNSKTQTKKSRFDRYSESSSKFKLIDTTFFENKHVLLVDDVITTGATIESCINALNATKDIKISVATMAYTSKD